MCVLVLASLASLAGGAARTLVALDAAKGKDGPSCGAPTAPCASVSGALACARSRRLTAVSLRCAEGQYPISTPLAIPSGADYEFTLTAPPLGQHRSFFSCAKGLPLPCVTVGDGASLRLDSLMVESMMVAAGPGGRLATHSCKFDLGTARSAPGQVGLLGEPPAASGAFPFVNMTDTDPASHPALQTAVALLATAPVPARILLGIGNRSAAVAKRAAATTAADEDDFKGYLWKQMGHDCYQPRYRTAAAPSTKKLLTVAADGSADFETVQAAVNAVPEGGRNSWADAVTIHIRAGTYNETVCINRNKSFVTLEGAGSGSTSIVGAQGSVKLMWPNGSTVPNADGNWPSCGIVRIVSDDVRLQDLKVHNSGTRGGNHNVALQVLGERVAVSRASIVGVADEPGLRHVTHVHFCGEIQTEHRRLADRQRHNDERHVHRHLKLGEQLVADEQGQGLRVHQVPPQLLDLLLIAAQYHRPDWQTKKGRNSHRGRLEMHCALHIQTCLPPLKTKTRNPIDMIM